MTAESCRAFYFRRLHSLLGIVPIGAFFCEHVLTNSLAFFEGPEKFDKTALFLQELPFIRFLEIFLIGIPILLHAVLGLMVWWNSRCNLHEYGYLRNWLHFLQRWTGIGALVFILVHVWGMRISWTFHSGMEHVDFAYVSQVFNRSLLIPFYVAGVACVSFHFANGLWNFLITWGIAVSERSQRDLLALCGIVGIVIFCGFMFSLAAFVAA